MRNRDTGEIAWKWNEAVRNERIIRYERAIFSSFRAAELRQ